MKKHLLVSIVDNSSEHIHLALGIPEERTKELQEKANEIVTGDHNICEDMVLLSKECKSANELAWIMLQFGGNIQESKHQIQNHWE